MPTQKRCWQLFAMNRCPFDVMLGAYITAEVNNDECPWGGVYSPEQLLANKEDNKTGSDHSTDRADQCLSGYCQLGIPWQ